MVTTQERLTWAQETSQLLFAKFSLGHLLEGARPYDQPADTHKAAQDLTQGFFHLASHPGFMQQTTDAGLTIVTLGLQSSSSSDCVATWYFQVVKGTRQLSGL